MAPGAVVGVAVAAAVVAVATMLATGASAAFVCVEPARLEPPLAASDTQTIFFAQLPCAVGADTYYIGNYSVQADQPFTLRYGDQDCADDIGDNSRFDYAETSFNDVFEYKAEFGYYPVSSNYRVKAQLTCGTLAGPLGCDINYKVCMGIYPRSALANRG